MKSRNSVALIGRLTKDNELKYYDNQNGGGSLVKNTIAVRGDKKDETIFIDFTAWGKTADNLVKYTGKGKKIALSGELVQERWQDKSTGQERTKIALKVTDFELIESAGDNQAQPNQAPQQRQTQANAPMSYGNYDTMPAEVQQAVNRHNASYNQAPQGVISEDEIPF